MAVSGGVGSAQADPLPGVIPVFPLPGALLLPRAHLPLHIFEPRYLAMVRDAMKGEKIIGMVQPYGVLDDGRPGLFSVGCAGQIAQCEETEDGRLLIALKGVCRFRIARELAVTTPYRQVQADYAPYVQDRMPAAPLPSTLRGELLDQLVQYLEARTLKADWDSIHNADDEMLVSAICMLCPFGETEKQALLEAASLPERTEAVILLMRFTAGETGPTDVRH